MSNFPYVFTFYSFKGGVGRSLALLNCAYTLASWGRRVIVLDMDLEAPGISGFLTRQDELGQRSRFDIVDLVAWACGHAAKYGETAFDRDVIREHALPFSEFATPIRRAKLNHEALRPRVGRVGEIDVVSAHDDRDYYRRLEDLRLADLDKDRLVLVGRVLKSYLKAQTVPLEWPDYYGDAAPREAPYDYALVDSRTGITETGGLCIGPLADRLIVLTSLNDQNVEGTRRFLEQVGITLRREDVEKPWDEGDVPPDSPEAPPRLGPKPTLVVASPVPSGEVEYKRQRLEVLKQALGQEVAARLSYHPRMALIESVFVRDYPEEYLALEYRALSERLLALVGDHFQQLSFSSQAHWYSNNNRARAIEEVLRLTPQQPLLGRGIIQLFYEPLEPKTDEEFVAADRMLRALADLGEENAARTNHKLGKNLAIWAERTSDDGLRCLRFRAAIQIYNILLEDNLLTPQIRALLMFNRAIALNKTGDKEGAITDFIAVVDTNNAPAEAMGKALGNLGWYHYEKGDFDSSLDASRRALEIDPELSWVRGNLGLALLLLGRTEEALREYATAIAEITTVEELERAVVPDLEEALQKHGDLPGAHQVLELIEQRRQVLLQEAEEEH